MSANNNTREGARMDVKSVGKVLAIAAIIIAVGVMIAIPAMDGNSLEGAPTQFDENGIRYEVITPEGVSPGEVTVKQYLGKKPIGELILPDTVKEYTVTKISANAFRGCTELKSVTLPAGLTVIENHAFYGNTLMDVTNKGILPESLVSIGEGAFGLCPALGSNDNELVIPDGVSVLNNTVFHKCGKLAKVTLPSKLERIGDNTFDTCATMTLTSGIPDSVKSIGARAFAECANIGTINYPDSLTSVGDWAFYKCSILDFSNSSRSSAGSLTIGLKAFYLCKSLKNIPLPEKISVAESSFQSCNLMDIPGGGALTINSIGGSKAFSGCTALGTNGISIILSDKITDTVFETFLNCSSITAVHLSANLTTVSNNSFQGCTNMYVDNPGILPPKVTSVGSSGFSGCNNLGSAVSNHLVIPATFKEFKNNAFFDCGSIDLITFQTQSPPAHMNASLQVTKAGPVKKVAVYSLFDPSVYNNPHCRGDFVDLVWEKPLCATVGCEFPKGTITPGVGTHVVPIGWGFTLSVSPSPGYIAKVTSDVAFTKVGNTYTVKEVNTSIKMDVVFVETFTVNVDAGDGGMVMYSIEGDKPVKCTGSVTAEKGQTVHLEAVQDGKHTFGSWSNGQIVAGIDVVSASDLAVNWLNIFRVSLDGCDYGKVFYNIGGVDFTEYEGVLTLDTGSSVHMKAVANEGYRLYEWSDKVTVTERIFDSETHLSLKWMKTYSILVSQSPGGTLKLAENKHNVYDVGSNVQITAVPDKGYRLKELYVNGASVAFSDNTYTIKNLAADSSVTAEWIQQFRVDLTTAKGGTISFQNEKPDVSSKLFDIGADVNLVFTPSEGYSPNTLILDGVETKVTDGKYTIRSISANHTVAATWIKQYVVEFTTNEGGRVSFLAWDNGIKSRKFDEGSKVVITAVPQDGYVLASLTVNGNSAELKGDRYIIEKLSENTKLVFTWQKTFAVTVDLVPGGKVMWKIDGQYAEYVSPVKAVSGKIVWLKAVPNDDHRFVKWSDEKTTEEVSYIDAAKVSPVWMKRYTVSIVNTEGGTVKFLGDPSSTKKFDAGTDVVLEITANPGYALSQFTVGGTTAKVTDGKHTITNINADCEAKALWVKQFDVSLKTTAGGSINFSGKGSDVTVFTFDAGSKVVIETSPSADYRMLSFTVNGTPATTENGKYTINDLQAKTTVEVSWQKTFTVTVNQVSGGTVQFMMGDKYVDYTKPIVADTGQSVKLRAVPGENHRFAKWSDDKTTVDVSYAESVTVSPVWVKTFTVTADKGTNGKIQFKIDNGTYADYSRPVVADDKQTVWLKAVPDAGYRFSKWSDGDDIAEKKFITTGSVIASWKKTFTVTADKGTNGKVQFKIDNGTYADYTRPVVADDGQTVWLKAVPDTGYRFLKWSDDKTEQERNFTKDASTSASWMRMYSVTLVTDIGGSIGFLEIAQLLHKDFDSGSNVVVTVSPSTDYRMLSFTVNGASATPQDGKYTINNLQTNTTVKVSWQKTFTVTVNQGANGKVQLKIDSGTYSDYTKPVVADDKQTVWLKAVPNADYRFLKWSDNNAETERSFVSSTSQTAEWQKTFTVTVNQGANGKVQFKINNGTYADYTKPVVADDKQTVWLKAVPDTGYRFLKWSDNKTEIKRSFLVGASTGASWMKTYSVTIETGAGGSISFPDYAGFKQKDFDVGSRIVIAVTPDKDYRMLSFTVNGASAATQDGKYTINNLQTNTTVKVSWQNTFTVTVGPCTGGVVQYKITGSYVNYSRPIIADVGQTVYLKGVPNTNYRFLKWSDGLTEPERFFTSTATTAAEMREAYVVTLSDGTGGKSNFYGFGPETTSMLIDKGTKVVIEFKADKDNRLNSVKVNNRGVTFKNNSYTIDSLTTNTTVSTEWKATFTVTVDAGANGTVYYRNSSGSLVLYEKPVTVDVGKTVSIKAQPNTGYRFLQWSDGDDKADKKFTSSGSVNASWMKTFTVTADKGTNGKVQFKIDNGTYANYTKPVVADDKQTVWLKAVPDTGYRFLTWSDNVTASERSFIADATVGASWKQTYKVFLNARTVGGSVAFVDEPASVRDKEFDIGSKVTVAVGSDANYRVKWFGVNGIVAELKDGKYTIDSLNANATISVDWQKTFTVTINAGEGGSVKYKISATEFIPYDKPIVADVGQTVSVSANAGMGYRLLKWSDGVTGNFRQFNLESTVSIEWQKTFRVIVDTGTNGTVLYNIDGGTYKAYDKFAVADDGQTIGLKAVPNSGYRFLQWSDGKTGIEVSYTLRTEVAMTWIKTFEVTVGTSSGGTISIAGTEPGTTSKTFDVNSKVVITVKADTDNRMKSFTVNGKDTEISGGTYTIDSLQADSKAKVVWQKTFTVTVNPGANGTVNYKIDNGEFRPYSTPVTADDGMRIHLKAEPANGYRFLKWTNGSTDANASFGSNTTIGAEWMKLHTVSISNAVGGTVKFQGENPDKTSKIFDAGSDVILEVAADTGYRLLKFTMDGSEATIADGKYKIQSIAGDHTAAATWMKLYTVKLETNAGGVVNFSGEKPDVTSKIFDAGSKVVVELKADTSFRLVSLTVDDAIVKVSENSYTIEDLQKDLTAKAVWQKTFTVTVNQGIGGTVQYKINDEAYTQYVSAITADVGQTVWLNATASPNNTFAGWSDGIKTAERRVMSDCDLTAEWYRTCEVAVMYSEGGKSPSAGTVSIVAGRSIIVEVEPDTSYRSQARIGNGEPIRIPGPYPAKLTVPISQDVTIYVEYIKQVTVTLNESSKGTLRFVDYESNVAVVDAGSAVKLDAVPEKDYVLSGYVVNGTFMPGATTTLSFKEDSSTSALFTEAAAGETTIWPWLILIVTLAIVMVAIIIYLAHKRRNKEDEAGAV